MVLADNSAQRARNRLLAMAAAPMRRGTRGVRLRTLSNLRWLAVAGQSVALFVVYFVLGYKLPLIRCAAAIAMSALLNIGLAIRYPAAYRLTNRDATGYLAYDVLQLASLLYLTGGIENPFALMFVAPVVIGASTLNFGNSLRLAAIAFAAVCVITLFHDPLPWPAGQALDLPQLYRIGIWSSLVLGIAFTSIYAWRVASESARMSAGLAATQLALAREHRLASLGALATAAAHELGTPLGTIAVVAHELERSLPQDSQEAEDVRLLRAQAERCRAILTRLSRPEMSALEATQSLPIGALLEEIASVHRGDDIEITIDIPPGTEPKVWRAPELMHGFGNIIENAADFARSWVRVEVHWDDKILRVTVEDDGPGFAPDILEQIGEPYVTSRPGQHAIDEDVVDVEPSEEHEGMGLGFFIAKTLLERTRGTVTAGNLADGGARVTVTWRRGAIDGDTPSPSR
jgi:two-component system sensor histidine kinase RegB